MATDEELATLHHVKQRDPLDLVHVFHPDLADPPPDCLPDPALPGA